MSKVFAVLFLALFAQAGGQSIPIPIQNPNFEQGLAGWDCSAGSSVIQFNGVPFLDLGYGASCEQTVQVPEMPVGIYTLTFSIENFFYWYPGEWTAAVSLSNFYESPLCSTSFHPSGDSMQMSIVCPVRDMYAQNLTVSFSDKGWQSLVTNVSLTFTPQN